MVSTNLGVRLSRKSVWHVAAAYITRSQIEAKIRFTKHRYELDEVRLSTYRQLQNFMALVIAEVYFTALDLGIRLRLRFLARHMIQAAIAYLRFPTSGFTLELTVSSAVC